MDRCPDCALADAAAESGATPVPTRRALLGAAGLTAAVAAADVVAPSYAFAASPAPGDVLVLVFLRGGMDGLSAVVPYADPAYHASRPTLRVPGEKVVRLDGRFGLHPSLRDLAPIWARRDLAVVHAVGTAVTTRSHFDAQDMIERGTPGSKSTQSGWLGRHLATRPGRSAFRAVAMGSVVQASLYGPVAPIALRGIKEFQVSASAGGERVAVETTLSRLYAGLSHSLGGFAGSTLEAVRRLRPLTSGDYKPARGVTYPSSTFGRQLSEVARLVKARLGLEVACLDVAGWDTHSNQGSWKDGALADRLADLGKGLNAFYNDLGGLGGVTVVVMSEFGRRVDENGSHGTDHGNGNAMLVLGRGIRGGKVYGGWPTVAKGRRYNGDLAPVADYRDVLSDVLYARLRNRSLGTVFPRHRVRLPGLADPR